MELAWWHWMVFGLGLGLAELAIPSFFIVWFGLGALLVGLLLLFAPETGFTAQILIWTLASVGFAIAWFKWLRPTTDKTQAGQADEALGEIGVLIRAVEPYEKGELRFQKPVMGSETWPCTADVAIDVGERVRVLAVDGQLLKVGKA